MKPSTSPWLTIHLLGRDSDDTCFRWQVFLISGRNLRVLPAKTKLWAVTASHLLRCYIFPGICPWRWQEGQGSPSTCQLSLWVTHQMAQGSVLCLTHQGQDRTLKFQQCRGWKVLNASSPQISSPLLSMYHEIQEHWLQPTTNSTRNYQAD